MNLQLRGLLAAPHTPFDANGDVDLTVIQEQADYLVRNGVAGVFVCGTTGEGLSLTLRERMNMLDVWTITAPAGFHVIAHVGAASERDAIALTKHAVDAGVDAVAALPCFYHRPASVDAAVDSLAAIAEAADGLPTYYYHLPGLTQVDFSMMDFIANASRMVNFAGCKYSKPDLIEYAQLVREYGNAYDLPWGCDEHYLSAALAGAVSFVGSTYNHSARLYHRLQSAIDDVRIDDARQLSGNVQELIRMLVTGGVIPTQKRLLDALGIPVGDVRSPLRFIGDDSLIASLLATGWIDAAPASEMDV
jgi:N-acetylneuraminate lyase